MSIPMSFSGSSGTSTDVSLIGPETGTTFGGKEGSVFNIGGSPEAGGNIGSMLQPFAFLGFVAFVAFLLLRRK